MRVLQGGLRTEKIKDHGYKNFVFPNHKQDTLVDNLQNHERLSQGSILIAHHIPKSFSRNDPNHSEESRLKTMANRVVKSQVSVNNSSSSWVMKKPSGQGS